MFGSLLSLICLLIVFVLCFLCPKSINKAPLNYSKDNATLRYVDDASDHKVISCDCDLEKMNRDEKIEHQLTCVIFRDRNPDLKNPQYEKL